VLIVEDVTTTGGQILTSAKELQVAGAQIVGVCLVIARAQEAVQVLASNNIDLVALILPTDIEMLAK